MLKGLEMPGSELGVAGPQDHCIVGYRGMRLISNLPPFSQQSGWLLMSPTTRAIWKVLLPPIPPFEAALGLPYPGSALLYGFNSEAWAWTSVRTIPAPSISVATFFETKWYDLLPFLTESDEVAYQGDWSWGRGQAVVLWSVSGNKSIVP